MAYRMTLPAGLRLEATRRMMVLFSMLLLADLTLIGMSAHHAWRNPAEWQVLRLPIQFIPDYVLCPLQISIGEAFLMMFIFKLLFSWMLAAWSTFFFAAEVADSLCIAHAGHSRRIVAGEHSRRF